MSEAKSRITAMSQGPGAYCKVCGDRASGKHYGVASCDGCRGFFKRSIRRNLEYTCKEGGKCIVDVSRRNQCQACRFAKCLEANMRREAVQHERAPRSCISNHQTNAALAASTLDLYSVQRRLPLHPSSIVHLPMPMHLPLPTAFAPLDAHRYLPSTAAAGPYHPPSFLDTLHYGSSVFNAPALRTFQPPAATKASDGLFVQPTPTRPLPKNGECTIAKEDEVTSSEETKLMDMPNYLPSAFSHTYSLERETISESAAKLLFLAVKWAKSVPSFNHILPRDQNILIEETWAELFVITSAQYGLPVENLLLTSPDIDVKKLQNAISQLILLRMDYTEMACLKTIVLFRPDCPSLSSPPQISMLQDETIKILLEKCGGRRMAHILLTIPIIRSAGDGQMLQELFFKKTVGEVAIERLLGELMRH